MTNPYGTRFGLARFRGASPPFLRRGGLAFLPIAAELSRRGHTTFVPKPQKTHLVRKVLAPFAKTDAFDAKAQALVRHLDPDGVHPLQVPSAEETTLRLCVKQRARLVVDAARAKGRIRAWLVLAHPHLGEVPIVGRCCKDGVAALSDSPSAAPIS